MYVLVPYCNVPRRTSVNRIVLVFVCVTRTQIREYPMLSVFVPQ